ncbi:hypothetical protein GGX14DRAFT_636843 [Mycena pura]|uniref:Altered inheritance of mitochondria protein 6 n=1 Tax=Mycena pura TaxID=153505 RepID=A0AAD6VCG5_9AGAR|nr:hypothetical protein GGX14DRAFT_636843 [Mycena pura]
MLALFALAASFVSTTLAAVKPIHSHNDYLQAVPFWTALNLSIMSVEADVWWQDNQLFVAHTSGEIDKTKTLDSLYLTNILGVINGSISSITPISVNNPLQLLIDFKSDGPTTYQPVLDALQPLRAGGHLTTFADGVLKQGAVTAVGTGNTPLASVVAAAPRDLFFDADIRQLYSSLPGTGLAWGPQIAPLASVDFASVSNVRASVTPSPSLIPRLTRTQTAQMQELVLNAHDFGIRARFWDTPANVGTWDTFWAAGSDWVNADDLLAVSNAWAAFDAAARAMQGNFEERQFEADVRLQRM